MCSCHSATCSERISRRMSLSVGSVSGRRRPSGRSASASPLPGYRSGKQPPCYGSSAWIARTEQSDSGFTGWPTAWRARRQQRRRGSLSMSWLSELTVSSTGSMRRSTPRQNCCWALSSSNGAGPTPQQRFCARLTGNTIFQTPCFWSMAMAI